MPSYTNRILVTINIDKMKKILIFFPLILKGHQTNLIKPISRNISKNTKIM